MGWSQGRITRGPMRWAVHRWCWVEVAPNSRLSEFANEIYYSLLLTKPRRPRKEHQWIITILFAPFPFSCSCPLKLNCLRNDVCEEGYKYEYEIIHSSRWNGTGMKWRGRYERWKIYWKVLSKERNSLNVTTSECCQMNSSELLINIYIFPCHFLSFKFVYGIVVENTNSI